MNAKFKEEEKSGNYTNVYYTWKDEPQVCAEVEVEVMGMKTANDACVPESKCGEKVDVGLVKTSINCPMNPIVAIIIVVVIVILLGVCIYCCCCKKKPQQVVMVQAPPQQQQPM